MGTFPGGPSQERKPDTTKSSEHALLALLLEGFWKSAALRLFPSSFSCLWPR